MNNNVYLIYGLDYSLIKKEIDKIKKDYTDIVKYDLSENNISNVLDDASCISLFGTKKVLIAENCNFLLPNNSMDQKELNYLEKYILSNNDNIVILTVISDKLDERKKIVKLIKENCNIIHKEVINTKDLPNFVINEFKNDGYKIDYKTANYFIDYVGNNIDILISEIEKIKLFKETEKEITIDDINDISSKKINDNVFDLCDAIMKRNFKKIYSCYNDLLLLKQDQTKLISLIANQFILVYQVKLLNENKYSVNEIEKLLKVHPYRVKLALETDYLIYELKDIINKLSLLDYNIKSGNLDKNNGFESFLLKL